MLEPDLLTLAQIGLRHLGYDPGPIDGLEGPRTLAAYEAWKHDDPTSAREPGWMKIARGEMGVKEHVGGTDHPRIAEYLHTTTLPEPYRNRDETSWCSAFVNWCKAQVGIPGTNSAAARSWQHWGRELTEPVPGCIVVLWPGNPNSWQGHVGFFVSQDDRYVTLLGGNQGDAVTISRYARNRVLAYRMPDQNFG